MRGSSGPTDPSSPLLPSSPLRQISLFLSLSLSLSGSWPICRGGVRLTFRLSRFPQCQLRCGNEFPLSRGLLHLIWSSLAASPVLQELMSTPTFFFKTTITLSSLHSCHFSQCKNTTHHCVTDMYCCWVHPGFQLWSRSFTLLLLQGGL